MKIYTSTALAIISLASAKAAVVPTPTEEPCAQVSAAWATQDPSTATVPAELAYACLRSVPFNKARGVAIADSLVPYLEWQTDTEYLKDSPKGYDRPAYDMFAALKDIRAKAASKSYASEYDFQKDIQQRVFLPAADGHMRYSPDSMNAFRFAFPRGVVSYSDDGKSLPVIKLSDHYKKSTGTASILKSINGKAASQFLVDLATSATGGHVNDTAYNTMFDTPVGRGFFGASGPLGPFAQFSSFYQGKETTFGFANGTTLTLENTARVQANMTGVVDGQTFYDAFCVPSKSGKPQNAGPTSPNPPKAAYSNPIVRSSDNTVSGYFLQGEGVDNVAVLVLLDFDPEDIPEYQNTIQDFLKRSKSADKTKVVIDLQSNSGGIVPLGYELFRQFFPHTQQDGFTRWKASNLFLDLARVYTDYFADFDPYAPDVDPDKLDRYQSQYNVRFDVNSTFQPFTSYDDKFRPHMFKNTRYTNLMTYDLNDPTVKSGLGIDITGYQSRANATKYYDADDLVVLYNGYCASTCAVAAEMLRVNGGVKSVVLGGLPRSGPQQGVGGTRGAQVSYFSTIYSDARYAMNVTTDKAIKSRLSKLAHMAQFRVSGQVNGRDQILRGNVDDGMPAQFGTEYSDCRLYYTKPMLDDITEIWKAAARSAFNGAKCNYGGIRRT
ncbi:hypothetical protein VHEMI01573 [[Torrubiella] hemipterigena]|uniref:CPAF-like PDZ domain-containing protein n=1 Tax=[Torrubiella] hemipterigena TaxID=1531966 RepID=A0A0A1STF2_9HYPO|nr:hypothetical protein VHEMI01573 [[Torrubiella] hemipterigena]